MKLILIRGLPGSGKSTMAKTYHGYKHFEADMFFETWRGYKFDASKLSAAHSWCQNQTDNALSKGHDVVVSNTFSRRWEMQPYFDIAAKYGADVEVITAHGNYKNVHGVPDSVIEAMRNRWED